MAVEAAGLTMDDISSVGVGTPGTVNKKTGYIEFSNNLDFQNVPAQEMLRERLASRSIWKTTLTARRMVRRKRAQARA